METNEVPTDDGIIGNSETGVQDAEEAKVGGVEEVEEVEEESNVSFFNDSSLGEFEFEEKEPAVSDDIPAEGAAEDGPALSEVDEVEEEINADKEASKGKEEEAAPSKEAILEKLRKGGAMNVLADFPLPKEDQRDIVEEESNESLTERTSGTLDLKASEYFTKYPKAIANPQVSDSFQLFCLSLSKERSLKLFNEDAEGLPEGWKVQS